VAGAAAPLGGLARDVRAMLEAYRAAEATLPAAERERLAKLRAELDLDAGLDDLAGISELVERATGRAVRIVTNLRNFARQAGDPVPTDLHASLEETLLLLAARLKHAGIGVTKRFGSIPPVTCRAGEMNQVFMNLLVNAVHALEHLEQPDGERAIEIETRAVGDVVSVAIADSGPGVPEDIRAKIFDPFFTTKPRGEGTGLGLSMSTEIVRRHGGKLRYETSALGGARFVVDLPREASAQAPLSRSRARSAGRDDEPRP
jgi:signal transduction histidine kinase